jgi:trehalose 2-sulfotransferase
MAAGGYDAACNGASGATMAVRDRLAKLLFRKDVRPTHIGENVHAERIRRALKTVEYDGDGPSAGQLVLLGFVNRSGSNLLGEYLGSLPGLTDFGEKLNHRVVVRQCERKGIDGFPEYIRSLADAAGERRLGIKASGTQVEMLHKWNILSMFGGVRALHIVRQDIVSQAVSFWIANHTKQWTGMQRSAVSEQDVPYDPAAIGQIIQTIGRQNTRVVAAFSALAIPVRTVVYERLLAEPEAEMRSLGEFLELDMHGWQMPEDLSHERQVSRIKADFAARTRAALAASW